MKKKQAHHRKIRFISFVNENIHENIRNIQILYKIIYERNSFMER